jgi:hypothetical protein
MIFDPAVINKFDHAIIKDIRPSALRFFDPCRAEDFVECPTQFDPSEPTGANASTTIA